jgi:hypothetical protein
MEWSVFQWLLQIQLMIILVLQLVGGYVISHFVLTFCIEKVDAVVQLAICEGESL